MNMFYYTHVLFLRYHCISVNTFSYMCVLILRHIEHWVMGHASFLRYWCPLLIYMRIVIKILVAHSKTRVVQFKILPLHIKIIMCRFRDHACALPPWKHWKHSENQCFLVAEGSSWGMAPIWVWNNLFQILCLKFKTHPNMFNTRVS